MLKASVYSSSSSCFRSFLCFSYRSSLRRLSSNFFVGKIGARGRGRNSSLSIVILSFFFFGIWVYRICRVERRRKGKEESGPSYLQRLGTAVEEAQATTDLASVEP